MCSAFVIFEWLFYFSIMLVFVLAIFLNATILHILRRQPLKSTTFTLMTNQITAEIVFSLTVLSRNVFCWSAVVNSSETWSVVCGLVSSVSDAAIYVTAFSMLVIAYERYRKLYRPFISDLNTRRWIAGIWIVAISLALVNNVNKRNPMIFNENRLVGCKVTFRSDLHFFAKRYNFLVVFIFCDAIPLMFTAVLYYKVIRKIRERKLVGNTGTNAQRLGESKQKTTEMLIAIVVWYFLITIPFYVFQFVQIFVLRIDPVMACSQNNKPSIEAYFIAGIYFVGSLCANPFIILYYNPDFRHQFYRIFKIRRIFKRRRSEIQTIETIFYN